VRAIDTKLWRQLWGMRGQALAIALVIVSGVAIFIMSLSTLDSLFETRAAYYRDNHFAQVFASLKRAPLSVATRIAAIPGVDKVETRVVALVNMEVTGFPDPITGHLLSLPDHSRGLLNQVHLRSGRLMEPGRDNEILLSENFAQAHGLQPGATLHATINGRRKALSIVGIALSPEYIYQIAPGALFPDYQRYGVLWMARAPLAAAYDMEGAFNDVSLTLTAGANEQDVIDRLDDVLRDYGGRGAYARGDQFSNRFLSEELKQQRTVATVFPVIFFGVAAFLLNVVISRLIGLEREQIAALKAFGYSTFDITLHYLKLVTLIVAFGVAGGLAVGIWLGRMLGELYMMFYSFPYLIYVLTPKVILAAVSISVAMGILGTLHAVRKAARLPPAQAMQPEPPALYHVTVVERLGLSRWLAQPTRMILRHIERRPLKSLLTLLGIALACGIMMIGGFQQGAIDHMVAVEYGMSSREDLIANFTEATSDRALYSLRSIPGVEQVEGFRSVPARLRFQHRSYRTAVQGLAPDGDLLRLLDTELRPITLPQEGVILTDYLADLLHIRPGERLTIEVLEGNRISVEVPVVGITKQYLGMNVYLERRALNRLLKEGDAVSGAYLRTDRSQRERIYAALRGMPRVAGVIIHEKAIESFYATLAETVLFFTFIATILGATVSFGVVYNSMRIALAERNRELASLRVLGFTRGEVAYILLGELALLTLLALPIGLLIGYGLCGYMAFRFDTDLYRIPLVLDRDTYAFAAGVVIVSSIASALMIWRNLARLDMVAVLKTKE
jgi:putative ABC transport system permease protein